MPARTRHEGFCLAQIHPKAVPSWPTSRVMTLGLGSRVTHASHRTVIAPSHRPFCQSSCSSDTVEKDSVFANYKSVFCRQFAVSLAVEFVGVMFFQILAGTSAPKLAAFVNGFALAGVDLCCCQHQRRSPEPCSELQNRGLQLLSPHPHAGLHCPPDHWRHRGGLGLGWAGAWRW